MGFAEPVIGRRFARTRWSTDGEKSVSPARSNRLSWRSDKAGAKAEQRRRGDRIADHREDAMHLAKTVRLGCTALAVLALAGVAGTAHALDTIRVGKSVGVAWTFTPMEVGVETGIWEKHGFKVEITAFGGDARLQQALTGGSVDFGLGSGPSMGFMAKGVPAKAVAAFANSPNNIGLLVAPNAPYKSAKDLKGKNLGVTTVGSLTDWLVKQVSLAQGWGVDDLVSVPLGGPEANIAAMKTGRIDAIVLATEACYGLEEKGEGKLIENLGHYAPHFHTHVIFATNEMIDKHPDQVQRFLDGWFETIAFIKANKQKTVEITSKVLNLSQPVISRAYDEEISMLRDNGKFDPEAIKVIKESMVPLGILDTPPADDVMFTTKFVGK
jgi:NitT/TauT family transport system substrate-binding protein